MSRGRGRSGGYTIVELMIFLAVSGAMFASAMYFVSGQQQKAQFNQGVREFATDLQNIANDVSTGYASFPFGSGHCWTNGTTIVVNPTNPGGMDDCIFIGRAIQFAPGNQTDTYKTYSVVGKQHNGAQEVQDLQTAQPLALSPGASTYNTGGTEYAASVKQFTGGLTVLWVRYGTSEPLPAGNNTTGFGFFTNFAKYSGNQINSNSTQVSMLPIFSSPALSFTNTSPQFVDKLDTFLRTPGGANGTNAAATNTIVAVCLKSGGTNQQALVTLGGAANGNLQVKTTIGTTCP